MTAQVGPTAGELARFAPESRSIAPSGELTKKDEEVRHVDHAVLIQVGRAKLGAVPLFVLEIPNASALRGILNAWPVDIGQRQVVQGPLFHATLNQTGSVIKVGLSIVVHGALKRASFHDFDGAGIAGIEANWLKNKGTRGGQLQPPIRKA